MAKRRRCCNANYSSGRGNILPEQDINCSELWERIDQQLRELLNEDTYDRWMAGIRPVGISGQRCRLGVSNELFREWLSNNYKEMIEDLISAEHGRDLKVVFESGHTPLANPAKEKSDEQSSRKKSGSRKSTGKRKSLSRGKNEHGTYASRQTSYNRRFTFQNFIVGENSKFAHAACSAVSRAPGEAYNPLFIHAGTGLGKTHLLQAVAQDILSRYENACVEYMSSEDFANGYINALEKKQLPAFRQHYRNVDLLLIDDVHFFKGKDRLQEEFFHTFNALFNGHKQIVLTSDRPPHEIGGLEKRLVSRFEWGLATEIEPPDYETRTAILQKKQTEHGVKIPDEILDYIAARIRSNVRRLEGALIRLVSYASMTGSEITREVAESLLRPLMDKEATGYLTIEQVQRTVAEFFDVRVADMTSKKRPRNIAFPRQVAMYLCRRHTSFSTPAIADGFNRNHATVLHAVRTIEQRAENDEKSRQIVSLLDRKIRQ